MCICGGCGKLIDKKFYYCPWCGKSRVVQEKDDSAELRYAKFKEKQFQKRYNQLEKMEEQLDSLEKELSILVLSAEMHK
ncbi:hypothetical protein SAMN04487977_1134 [Treponema bryantii]|jgi:uncharacterized Zn finger protein (UPF0148 family)|uniref:Uncharacterized protein n=1 Tax=Treponema bryantii TaxID=163 RepID=A0A1H9JGG1_9SPIR|nr:hypothetical protein [Treponema bryantii]BDC92984.1 hypothetical protein TRBR_10810 [Treponema bryantii]SEQ86004.1 hypothetical protein SAMN04487977_1134 [Treponema bryantii]